MSEPGRIAPTQATTIYFDPQRNQFTGDVLQAQGHQGTSGAMGSTSPTGALAITFSPNMWTGPCMENDRRVQVAAHCNQIASRLFEAIQAMGSLKTRVLDSHNHGVQTEILKLVQMASGEGIDAEAARIILKSVVAKNPALKPLLTRALASAMGGAPWIQKEAKKHGLNAPESFSAPAAKILLALSDGENPPLTHDECTRIRQQLSNHQVFSAERAPIWEAAKSLNIEERQQLGDCFGQYSRGVYAKRMEYFKVSDACKILNEEIKDFLTGHNSLKRLCDAFNLLDIKLRENGFNIPQNFEIPSSIKGINQKLVDKARASVSAFRDAWKKFQTNPEDPSLESEEKALCQAFQEAQQQFGGEQKTLGSLKEKRETLEGELSQINRNLIRKDPPSKEEASLRRSFMAGKPNATPKDCWNAITSFSASKFQVLGNYDTWLTVVHEQKEHIEQAIMKHAGLCELGNTFNFEEGMQLAKQLKELKNWYEDGKEAQAFNALQYTFVPLGDVPDETLLRDGVVTLARDRMQALLYTAVNSLLPGQTDIPAFDGEGQDLGRNIKDVEKFLNAHSDIDPAAADQIRQMLAIAKEINA